MKKYLCLFLSLFCYSFGIAQYLSPKTIASAGNVKSNGGIIISNTIGQTFSKTLKNSGVLLTQGFQQPYLDFAPIFINGNSTTYSVCENDSNINISSLLAIYDLDIGQSETWSLLTTPVHGTAIVVCSSASNGDTLVPIGSSYILSIGYIGSDSFTVAVNDGIMSDTITIYININPLPNAGTIISTSNLCHDANNIISDTTSNSIGVWDATNAAISISGDTITGNFTGIDTLIYSVTNSCGIASTSKIITVNPLPAAGSITGLSVICATIPTTFNDITIGGTWYLMDSAIATVSNTGIITGFLKGTDTIKYIVTNICGSASATKIITIDSFPIAGSITGLSDLCVHSNITLADTIPISIGSSTWSSSNTHAIVSGGLVTGISAGIDTIRYSVTNSCGVAVASKIITVNPVPNAGVISGATNICTGANCTLADTIAVTMGSSTWSATNGSANITDSGIVTALSPGTDTIIYRINSGLCTHTTSHIITVNPTPTAGIISGDSLLCIGSTVRLTDTIPLFSATSAWSSTGGVSVSGTGVVLGLSVGLDTVFYTVTLGSCAAITTKSLTVITVPNAGSISGASGVCVGGSISLTDTTSIIYGSTEWNVTNANAFVSSSGKVTGISVGKDTVLYTVTNMCGATHTQKLITVDTPLIPKPITSKDSLCEGAKDTCTNLIDGWDWTVTNSHAAINTITGIVLGISAGLDTILYSKINYCGTFDTFHTLLIKPLPFAGTVIGMDSVCLSSFDTLFDVITGGVWQSLHTNIATVNNSGLVTPISVGEDSIAYSYTNYCGNSKTYKVLQITTTPTVGAISGKQIICTGEQFTVTEIAPYPHWWSATNSSAIVNNGVVQGISAGVDTIYAINGNLCGTASTTLQVAVVTTPDAGKIVGTSNACMNDTIYYTDSISCGLWSINDSTIAHLNTTGKVICLSTGIDTISYSIALDSNCKNTTSTTLTINPLPEIPVIHRKYNILYVDSIYTVYQWFLNSIPIIGANQYDYHATVPGKYSVMVNINSGCEISSDIYFIPTIAACEISELNIYPNPTQDIVTIDWCLPVNVILYSIDGKEILKQTNATSIDMKQLPSGNYLLNVFDLRNNRIKTCLVTKM